MLTLQNETVSVPMDLFHANDSTRLYFNTHLRTCLCEVVSPYIPMVQFMDVFNRSTDLVEAYQLRHFIFDKRSLRTFHQPSMEWYFVEWKPVVRDLGMADHLKILPDEPWFHRCVEAGRNDILKSYPEGLLDGISVRYVGSVEEAISTVAGERLVKG